MNEIFFTPQNDSPLDTDIRLSAQKTVDTSLRFFSVMETLTEFSARFPQVLALFEVVGIHPTKSHIPMNPYTNTPATESYTNIGEHCLAVGYAASKIIDALVKAGIAKAEEADTVIERALVHDLTKPYEIMRRNANAGRSPEEVYSDSAYEKLRPLLIQQGISPALVDYLISAGHETGSNSLRHFLSIEEDDAIRIVPGKVAEKIVHLADDMTFTSTPIRSGVAPVTLFLTPWERMLASRFIEKYPQIWKNGLGLSESREIVTVPDVYSPNPGIKIIGDYASLQVKVAGAIAREFKLYLDPASAQEPEYFIKALINR